MNDPRRSIVMAGLCLGLLLVRVSVGLPYHAFDWTAYSQPYEPTETPTSTATLMPIGTATTVATATATWTPTSTATSTATATLPTLPEFLNYLPLITRPLPSSSRSMAE